MGSIAGRVTRFGKPYTGIGVFCPGRAEPVFTDGEGNYVLRGLRPGIAGDRSNYGGENESHGFILPVTRAVYCI